MTEVREDRGVIKKALVDCLEPQCPVPFKQSIVVYQTTTFQQKRLLLSTYILFPYLKGVESDAQPRLQKKTRPFGMSYLIDENPPWYICLLLGFQVRAVNVVEFCLKR